MHHNRLTVLGGRRALRTFQNSHWLAVFAGRHAELLELGPRFVCQFETTVHDLKRLQKLSRRWPGLVLLLDFERRRIKGLAKALAGGLEHCEIGY